MTKHLPLILIILALIGAPQALDYEMLHGTEVKFFIVAIAVGALVLLVAGRSLFAKDETDARPFEGRLAKAALIGLVGYLALAWLSAIWAQYPLAAVLRSAELTVYILWAVLVAVALRERRQLSWLLWAFVAGGVLIALAALLHKQGPQYSMPTGNPNWLASLLIFAMCLCAERANFTKGSAGLRAAFAIVFALAFAAMGYVLYMTASESALVSMVAALVVLPIFVRVKRRWAISLALLALVAAGAVVDVSRGENSRIRAFSESKSVRIRLYMWDWAIELSRPNPVSGLGAGGYFPHVQTVGAAEINRMPGYFGQIVAHAHNEPLEVFVELGALGLIAFLVVVGAPLIGVLRLPRPGPHGQHTDMTRATAGVVPAVHPPGELEQARLQQRQPWHDSEGSAGPLHPSRRVGEDKSLHPSPLEGEGRVRGRTEESVRLDDLRSRVAGLAAALLAVFLQSLFTVGLRFWSVPVVFWTATGALIAAPGLLRESTDAKPRGAARLLFGRSFGACVVYMIVLAAGVGVGEYSLAVRGWQAALAGSVMTQADASMDAATRRAQLETATQSVFYVDRVRAHHALGKFYLASEAFGAALQEFDRVSRLCADYHDVELMVARTCLRQDRLREAIPRLVRYGAMRPADERTADFLCDYLVTLPAQTAYDEINRAAGEFPESSKIYAVAAMLALRSDPPKEDQALANLDRALERNTCDAHAAYLLGIERLKKDQYREARDFFRRAHDNGMRTVPLYLKLVRLETMLGEPERARKLLEEAKETFPKSDKIDEALKRIEKGE